MRYSDSWDEAKNLIKERADLVEIIGQHVDLKRSGFRYLGSCPFHQEKTPSFTVHPEQQFYHCFGCKASGDVFSFMMEYHHMDFPEALKTLAQKYQVELPEKRRSAQEIELEQRRQKMFDLNHKAAKIYHDYLLHQKDAAPARTYLKRRSISAEVLERYRLGYAPSVESAGWNYLTGCLDEEERALALEIGLLVSKEENRSYDRFRDRVMFPIADSRGRLCGFGGRILGPGEPKYLNSPESPIYNKSRLLFGLHQQRDAIRRQRKAILVEGNFDLLALVVNGIDEAVAPLGTALTGEQLRLLKPLADDVVLLFDGDEAGLKAAERSVPLFLAEQISGRVALLPADHDPDTFIAEFGATRLEEVINEAQPLPEFVLQQLINRHGKSLDGKFKIIEHLRPLLKAAASAVQRDTMARHFAAALDIDAGRLLAEVQKAAAPAPAGPQAASRQNRDLRLAGLDGALRSVLGFMVKHPGYFSQLLDHEIDRTLAGTVGETICLQLKALKDHELKQLEPEELFSELPPGEERTVVAAILTEGPETADPDPEGADYLLGEVLGWLDRQRLKRRSEELMQQIKDAERQGQVQAIAALLLEKMQVDRELKQS